MQGYVANLNLDEYRPGSKARLRQCYFILEQGGIGDYICAFPALEFIAETQPHILGTIVVMDSPDFLEFVTHVFSKYPKWRVITKSQQNQAEMVGKPHYAPSLRPINATGCHLVDLGFLYYAHLNPPPKEYNRHTTLDLSALEGLICEKPYVVMTPGATTPNRVLRPSAFNGIKQHVIDRGFIPVFLGKKKLTTIRGIDYEEGYDYDGGLDLREQTSLLQAAGIMSKAAMVVGLDNGLLHLAACTDVPILFGYNIASPQHRRPRRTSGKIWEIYPDVAQLPCTFCQSKMRFIFDHDFAKCLYKDMKCLDLIGDPKPWCDIIDQIITAESLNATYR